MAQVRLGRYEVEEGELPSICLRCGATASVRRKKTFTWHPQWVHVLVLAGGWPYIIVALVLNKRMRMAAPLCEAHKRHWQWRNVAIGLSLLLIFILAAVAGFLVAKMTKPGNPNSDILGGWMCVGVVIALLIWLVVMAILQHTAIRPMEITDRSITLTNVAPAFADAIRQAQYSKEPRKL